MSKKNNPISTNQSLSKSSFVTEEQVRLLYMQAPISNSVVIIISLLYYFILQPRLDSNLLLLWMMMLLLTALYRLYLWYSRKNRPEAKSATSWLNHYLIGCGLVGGAWSLIYSLLYGVNDPFVLAALLMLAFGVISSAVPILSAYIPAFILYTFPQGLMLIITLLRFEDTAYYWLALAVGVYLIMTTLFTRNTNRSIIQSIRLQEQNASLIKDLNNEINQRETLIAERTADLDATLQAIPDLLFELDENGKYLDIWTQNKKLLAAQKESLLGHTVTEMLPADAAHVVMTAIQEAAKTGTSHGQIISLPLKHGEHWFELSTSKKQHTDSSSHFIMLSRDVTDKFHMEAEQRKSEEKYRGIFNESIVTIYVFDEKKNFIDSNQAGLDLLGYSREELLSMSISDVNADPDAVIPTHNQLLGGGRICNYEHQLVHKDGKVITVLNNSKALIGADGTVIGLQSTLIDITDLKRLETQLQQAHKMEAIGLMAGSVAHDLNNILAGIVGYPELILENLPSNSELRKPLMAMHESGNRATAVVADLLTVARGVASSRESHNLNSIIQEYLNSPECYKLKSLHLNVTYQLKLDALQPSISCSSVHIKKSIMNLVTNATEAIVGEGTISVATSNRYIDTVASIKHDMKTGDYVVFSVRDTGSGISEQDVEHIFEPFYTRKKMGKSGTGLGLTVVWNTVQDHGGKIFVESSDKGTCFQLYFPVNKEKGFVQAETDTKEDFIGNGEYILVVDDEPQLRDLACRMLQSQGYNVNSVRSGELAIEFVKENHVDLIMIDMLMEPGINGRQAYEQIVKFHPGQKALIASGFSESDDVKATLKQGAGGFIKKPYSKDQLGRAVKEVLNK